MGNTLLILIGLVVVGLWAWTIFDISKSKFKFKSQKTQTIWLLAVLFFPIIGSMIYFMLRKSNSVTQKRKFNPDFKKYSPT